MGMAASQARYLALTSRMNDIEYQGQQINQQRTTLASQINALYNSLLEMNVPTPPSKQSFSKIEYSGILNASKFTLKNITPKSDGKYNLKLGFAQAGDIVSNTTKAATIISTPTEFKASPASNNADISNLFLIKHPAPAKGERYADEEAITQAGAGSNLMIQVAKDKIDESFLNMTGVHVFMSGKDDSGIVKDDGKHLVEVSSMADLQNYNGNVYIQCNVADVLDANGKIASSEENKLAALLFTNEGTSEAPVYTFNDNAYTWSEDDTTTWTTTKTSFTDEEKNIILNKNLLIIDGKGARYLTKNDINSNLKLENLLVIDSSGSTYENTESKAPYSAKKDDGTTIPMYTVAEALSKNVISQDIYDGAIRSLSNTFPDEDVANNFYIYIDNGGEINYVKKSDLVGITDEQSKHASVYKPTTGTYSETKEFDDCEITFDNDGKINSIYIEKDGKPYQIKLTAEEVTDTDAYEEAFNQYEYDKYKYDKEQEEINAKTSIIQAEDKNLELKLTRLDNERNAVNTELEAVKKVIQDNIDKGFKTFSG